MFKKTMAVGPLDPVASWVTGGTGVANALVWRADEGNVLKPFAAKRDDPVCENVWQSCLAGWRIATIIACIDHSGRESPAATTEQNKLGG